MHDWLADNIDIPALLNYNAVQAILHNNDHVNKNYYIYRDTEGTQRWTLLPWDLDLTFGRIWVGASLIDIIWADKDSVPVVVDKTTSDLVTRCWGHATIFPTSSYRRCSSTASCSSTTSATCTTAVCAR